MSRLEEILQKHEDQKEFHFHEIDKLTIIYPAVREYVKECVKASLDKAKTQLVKNADEIKPCAYKTGNWDGKQSDTIIAIDETGKYHIAVYYEGFMDGSAFEDWYDENDYLIDSHITHWMEPDFDKESITNPENIVLL